MALVFPLAREAFLDKLPVQEVVMSCAAQLQQNGLRGGEILTAEVGPALWQGSIVLAPMPARQAAEVEALLAALEVPGRSFLAYKKNQIGPAADPVGAALSGFSPQIKSIDEAQGLLQLQGLPVGYSISVGDFLSFSYGATPTRRALHRAQEAVVADALGNTPAFQVAPHIRPGAAIGEAVELLKPYCKAVLVPGSVSYGGTRNGKNFGLSFSFRQTLR
jgi:hypothetical protein